MTLVWIFVGFLSGAKLPPLFFTLPQGGRPVSPPFVLRCLCPPPDPFLLVPSPGGIPRVLLMCIAVWSSISETRVKAPLPRTCHAQLRNRALGITSRLCCVRFTASFQPLFRIIVTVAFFPFFSVVYPTFMYAIKSLSGDQRRDEPCERPSPARRGLKAVQLRPALADRAAHLLRVPRL